MVGAALTKPGRVSTARWCGSGERDGEEYARNRRVTAPLCDTGSKPGGSGPGAARTCRLVWAGNSWGGRHELPGRLRGKTAAYSQRGRRGIVGLLLRRANHSEHGNRLGSCPVAHVRWDGWGWAHRSPIGPGWGGAAVVLRAGESPCTWGRAAAVSRGEGRCNAGRRVAEGRCSWAAAGGVVDEGIGDAGQASPLGGGRPGPPVR